MLFSWMLRCLIASACFFTINTTNICNAVNFLKDDPNDANGEKKKLLLKTLPDSPDSGVQMDIREEEWIGVDFIRLLPEEVACTTLDNLKAWECEQGLLTLLRARGVSKAWRKLIDKNLHRLVRNRLRFGGLDNLLGARALECLRELPCLRGDGIFSGIKTLILEDPHVVSALSQDLGVFYGLRTLGISHVSSSDLRKLFLTPGKFPTFNSLTLNGCAVPEEEKEIILPQITSLTLRGDYRALFRQLEILKTNNLTHLSLKSTNCGSDEAESFRVNWMDLYPCLISLKMDGFFGPVPVELNLPNTLRALVCRSVGLSIVGIPPLEELFLEDNEVTTAQMGPIFRDWIMRFPQTPLTRLSIRENNLSDSGEILGDLIGKSPNLKKFDCESAGLKISDMQQMIPSFHNHEKLQEINVSANPIGAEITARLVRLMNEKQTKGRPFVIDCEYTS